MPMATLTKAAESGGNNSETEIKHFSIRDRAVTDKDILDIAKSKELSIEFCDCGLTTDHLQRLRTETKNAKFQITTLTISFMEIIKKELLEEACSLARKYGTTKLSLEYDHLDDESVEILQKAFQTKNKIESLRTLDVSYNFNIGATGFQTLGKIVSEFNITSLKATDCDIAYEKLHNFLNALHVEQPIELNIGCNEELTNECFETLAKFVSNKTIDRLILSGCELSKENISVFYKSLPQTGYMLKNLTRLDVSYNSTLEPDTALGSVVIKCGVTELSMAGCKLTEGHLKCLTNELKDHKMYLVNMRDNASIGQGIATIAEIVRRCEVEELNICDCMFSPHELAEFSKALDGAKVRRLHLGDQKREPDKEYIHELCALSVNVEDVLYLRFHKLSDDFRTSLQKSYTNSTKIDLIVGEKREVFYGKSMPAVVKEESLTPIPIEVDAAGSKAVRPERAVEESPTPIPIEVGAAGSKDVNQLEDMVPDKICDRPTTSVIADFKEPGRLKHKPDVQGIVGFVEEKGTVLLRKGIKDQDRLEDVFQNEICKKISSSIVDFKKFARSKNGLCLDEPDIQRIVNDNPTSVEEQKMQMLWLWKEKNETEAIAAHIRSIVKTFQGLESEKETEARVWSIARVFQEPESEKDSKEFDRSKHEPDIQGTLDDSHTFIEELGMLLTEEKKVNAIVMLDGNSGHLLSFVPKTKQWNRMWKMNRDLGCSTLLVFEDHIHALSRKSMHRLNYSDPTAEWTELQKSNEDHGDCPPAVALNDSLYVCGGGLYRAPTRSVEKYKAGQWQGVAALNVARCDTCAVAAKDCLYCIGGLDEQDHRLRSVEKFDEESDQWSEVEPTARPTYLASAVEKDGILHVADKYGHIQCMDIQKETWKIMKPDHWPSCIRRAHIHVVDDQLYVVFELYRDKGVEIYHLDERTEKMTLLCRRDDINMDHTNSIALQL